MALTPCPLAPGFTVDLTEDGLRVVIQTPDESETIAPLDAAERASSLFREGWRCRTLNQDVNPWRCMIPSRGTMPYIFAFDLAELLMAAAVEAMHNVERLAKPDPDPNDDEEEDDDSDELGTPALGADVPLLLEADLARIGA